MKTFISGSMSINTLPADFKQAIYQLKGTQVLVGDAYGVDYRVQDFLRELQILTTVYTIKDTPRNKRSVLFSVKHVPAHKSLPEKQKQQYKDVAMAEDCDAGLVLWDGKSYGSYCNILQLLKRGKPVQVFLNNKWLENITAESLQVLYKEGNKC